MPLEPQRQELLRLGFQIVSESQDCLIATQSRFHWDCAFTFLSYLVVVRRVQELTAPLLQADRKQYLAEARRLDRNLLPRGVQKGRALLLLYVADRTTTQAQALCEDPPLGRFATLFHPAALDLNTQHVWCFQGLRLLGGIYQSKLQFLVRRLLEPQVSDASWPHSHVGVTLGALLVLLPLLLVVGVPRVAALRLLPVVATPIAEVSAVTDLVAGPAHFCALSADQVRCWPSRAKRAAANPQVIEGLVRPRAVVLKLDDACALDSEGVKCWSNATGGPAKRVEGLGGATQLIGAADNYCALLRGEVRCWSDLATRPESLPGLKYPSNLYPSLSRYSFCVLDTEGIKCFRYQARETPPFYEPTFWISGVGRIIALSADEWTNRIVVLEQGRLLSYYDVTASRLGTKPSRDKRSFDKPLTLKTLQGFRNPRTLVEHSIHTFALDEEGVKRVDPGGKFEENEMVLPGGTRVRIDRGGLQNGALQSGPTIPSALWGGPDSYVFTREEKGKALLRCSGWRKGRRDQFVVHGVTDPKKVVYGLYEACALDGTEVKCWQIP